MAKPGHMLRDTEPLPDVVPGRAELHPRPNASAYHLVGGHLLRIATHDARAQAAFAAAEIFRTAVREIPDDTSLHNALGGALLATTRFQSGAAGLDYLAEAEQALQTAITLAERQSAQDAVRLRYTINLAMARWIRGERSDDGAIIEQAVQTLRSIAQELPASSPYWAHVHDNMGNALMAQGHAGEAVAAYEAALAGRQSASERARSLNNLGTALAELKNWRSASQSYRDALALLPPDEFPLTRALAQHNLATALLQEALASAAPKTRQHILSDAITAFEAALQVRQQAQTPLDWAVTTVNLADAQLALAAGAPDRAASLARIRSAIDNYKAALAELTPSDVTKTLHNLRIAWEMLAKVAGAAAAKPEIAAHQRDVQAFTKPTALPASLDWPTETYASARHARNENIVEFLTRVWLPLIKVGAVDLRTLRLRDPSAAKAINNFRQRIDPRTGERRQLPPELDIPTKKQVNDRLAATVSDPGQRPARLDWALRSRIRRERVKGKT